jgi:hypothetical protein
MKAISKKPEIPISLRNSNAIGFKSFLKANDSPLLPYYLYYLCEDMGKYKTRYSK